MLACVADPFYKIAAEALLVLQELVRRCGATGRASEAGPRALRWRDVRGHPGPASGHRPGPGGEETEPSPAWAPCGPSEAARLGDDLEPSLLLLLDRLRARSHGSAVKGAFSRCGRVPHWGISLQPILAEALPILASFLRRTSGRCGWPR